MQNFCSAEIFATLHFFFDLNRPFSEQKRSAWVLRTDSRSMELSTNPLADARIVR